MRRLHQLRTMTAYLALAALMGLGVVGWRQWNQPVPLQLPTVLIGRGSVEAALTAPGTIEAARRTELKCQLEELPLDGSLGGGFSRGFSILEMLPEGAHVKKGDVICQLDDSKFQELVRRQSIKVMRDEADYQIATLQVETAQITLRSFTEGEKLQRLEAFQGQIAVLQSDIKRGTERLAWTENLSHLGYVTNNQVATDKAALLKLEVQLENAQTAFQNFQTYIYPRSIRQYEVQVETAERNRQFLETQYKLSKERLEHYQDLVDKTTIRAPHEGLLVYAKRNKKAPKLNPNDLAYQNMKMFYLPDLSHLVAQVQLHESVATQVQVGMPVVIRVETLPGREIQGKIASVDPVPFNNWMSGLDVVQFRAKVELIDPPPDLLPDMSVEARIVTSQHRDTIVIPSRALTIEDGWPYCYVAGPDGSFERRLLKLSTGDEEYYSVVDGVLEGEQVVLDPSSLRAHPDSSIDPIPGNEPVPEQTSKRTEPPLSYHSPALKTPA